MGWVRLGHTKWTHGQLWFDIDKRKRSGVNDVVSMPPYSQNDQRNSFRHALVCRFVKRNNDIGVFHVLAKSEDDR